MPTFAFAGRTRGGETVSGERVADSIDALTTALRREQIQVTKVNPVKEEKAAKAKKPKGRKVAAKNLAVFTRSSALGPWHCFQLLRKTKNAMRAG